MPPDADSLRQQRSQQEQGRPTHEQQLDRVVDGVEEESVPTTLYQSRSMNTLQPNEICIDGYIYDIMNFNHPGGDTIQVFGGNDVSVQYKMIHPYHNNKQLEKMKRIGKVSDFFSDYVFDTPFEREIKQEVFKIVRRGREFGTSGWFLRAFCYIAIMFYLQYLWVSKGSSWQLAIVYGISHALIGLNVQHDANHGACSKRPWVNDIFGLGADFIGGSKWLWMEQHWTHHAYTNHVVKDPDSFSAEPFLIFNDYPPGHPKRKWFHQLNVLLFFPVLAGYWASAVFSPEVLNLRHFGAAAIGIKMDSDFIKRRRPYAVFLRFLYICINVVTPFMHHSMIWRPLRDILLFGVSGSLALAVVFSLSHNFENVDRDPTADVKRTGQPVCWFKSQVETSSTYGGFISGCITGGLNFQIEHHLFPRMSSAWYPYIAPTVRDICHKHGVRYVYYPWIWQNIISTLKYVHVTGTAANWANKKE